MDDIDIQIIDMLQKNSRVSNVTLSKLGGLSAPPTLRRVRILEKSGIIEGYHANLNKKALGLNEHYWVNVILDSDDSDFDLFEKTCSSLDWIQSFYLLAASEVDYLIEVVTHSHAEYLDLMEKHIKPLVVSYKTFHVSRVEEKNCLPIQKERIPTFYHKSRGRPVTPKLNCDQPSINAY